MAKKHDENKDVRLFSKVGRVDYANHTLSASKSVTIGIRMWGRIDFLTHYCGWHFIWDNSAVAIKVISNSDSPNKLNNVKNTKKDSKTHSLTNKNKKQSKRV